MSKKRLIFVELNELNFDIIQRYLDKGMDLPNFSRLMQNGLKHTSSESEYKNIEPWIQWPSVHLGTHYKDHKIFRLGDIVNNDEQQIFEKVECLGYSVGCISPMNARNDLSRPDFFIPDPWTDTPCDTTWQSRYIFSALKQAVNDNSAGSITSRSLLRLALGLGATLRFTQLFKLSGYLLKAVSKKYRKAIFLDKILLELFITLFEKRRTQFGTLFLNAGAHIQHHYMASSSVIDGKTVDNPSWYLAPDLDPLCEILKEYDAAIGNLMNIKDTDILVATGLTQEPYETVQFYYRLTNHSAFFSELGLVFQDIQPRMTRDFLVNFKNNDDRDKFADYLMKLRVCGQAIFGEIDLRDKSAFVTLTYAMEVQGSDQVELSGQQVIKSFKQHISFVAIKNGHHNGKGFVLSSNKSLLDRIVEKQHVAQLHNLILDYFGARN